MTGRRRQSYNEAGDRWCTKGEHWCDPSEFSPRPASADGLQYQCRACCANRQTVRKRANRLMGRPLTLPILGAGPPVHRSGYGQLCNDCGRWKPWTEFVRVKGRRLPRTSKCRDCMTAAKAAWQRANPDRLKAYQREWRRRRAG